MTTLPPQPGIFRGQRGSRLLVAGLILTVSALAIFVAAFIGAQLVANEIDTRTLERTTSMIDTDDLEGVQDVIALAGALPVLLILAAACCLIPGEMKRRGGWATR